MTHALRGCDPAAVPFTRNDQVSYSYGDCHPAGNGQSCVDPIEVQSAPLCERHAAIYSAEPNPDDTPYQHTDLTIRGVPAASYDGGTTVEIYTADTTITIMGQDPPQVMRFASAVGPAPASDVPDHATVFTTLPSGVPGVGAGLPDLPPPNQTTLASTKAC